VSAEFELLPEDHELTVASVALAALGGDRLIIRAHRLVVDDAPDDDALADMYATFLGYCALGMPWVRVPSDELVHLLSPLVSKEMAYGQGVVDETASREAVGRWLACFPRSSRAYTNGELLFEHARSGSHGAGWNPIIGATFDTGAIVLASDVVGMVWGADED
jgi:hypothetical protein